MYDKPLFKRFLTGAFLLLLSLSLLTGCKLAEEPGESLPQLPQSKTLSDPEWIELEKAIQAAAEGREDVLAFLLYRVTIDDVTFSEDGSTALVWIALVDRKTGAVQSAEPGLVIAHKGSDGAWSVVFQADSTFAAELQALPDSMISEGDKLMYMPGIQGESKDGTVYRGYHLPWADGQTKYLTGSIGHVYTYKSCPSTCRYAYDFADGTQFAILAARGGTVKYAVWKYEDGNTTNANYIVLEDTSTSPTTYQVYYHLKQNSIPTALRTVGAKVVQGQLIGYADDTGASTGNHLHFMVHTNSTSYWGTSVDIRFDEVTINDGTPRLCSEAEAYPEYGTGCASKYTSANDGVDVEASTGTITAPAAYSTITTGEINVTGTMTDNDKVASGQLMITTNGTWQAISGTLTGSTFSTNIDLCDADIPDGTFFLSLVVTDETGNVSVKNTALTELTKSYTCPIDPPVCTPGDDQVALTTGIDYQGECELLDIGKYPDLDELDSVHSNETSSVQVGSNVSLLLYLDPDYGGDVDFYQASDANLNDNPIGLQNASSAKVVAKLDLPSIPEISLPENPTSDDDIQFTWTADDGAESQASLSGPDDFSASTDWLEDPVWHVGSLTAGDYTLTVAVKNLAGAVATTMEFSVSQAVEAPVASLDTLADVTYSTAVKLTWQVESGVVNVDHFEIRYQENYGDWQDVNTQPTEDERSLVFHGSLGSTYGFQIRGVTAAGKALDFLDTAQTMTYLYDSCTGDAYEGIDPGDDVMATAAALTLSQEQTHNWCPANDIDWMYFTATEGQKLEFTASPTGTNAAAVMLLYASDGSTILGEHHPDDAESDSTLKWTVPTDGTYYLKLTPKDSRLCGSEATYIVKFMEASSASTGTVICGSLAIPVLFGGAAAVAKKISDKKKKEAKRAGWK